MLPKGPHRDKFLDMARWDEVEKRRQSDERAFEKADYGHEQALLSGYWPSAAWAWLVCDMEHPPVIGYNDV